MNLTSPAGVELPCAVSTVSAVFVASETTIVGVTTKGDGDDSESALQSVVDAHRFEDDRGIIVSRCDAAAQLR